MLLHVQQHQYIKSKAFIRMDAMSGGKRTAEQSFGSSQLVKRQKSNGDLSGGAMVRANVVGAVVSGGIP